MSRTAEDLGEEVVRLLRAKNQELEAKVEGLMKALEQRDTIIDMLVEGVARLKVKVRD